MFVVFKAAFYSLQNFISSNEHYIAHAYNHTNYVPSNGTQTSSLYCLSLLDKPKNLKQQPPKHSTDVVRLTTQLPCFLTPGIPDPLSGKNKKDHIKKPLNAFMLYMKEMRPVVQAECTLKESAAINQILGRRVRKLNHLVQQNELDQLC